MNKKCSSILVVSLFAALLLVSAVSAEEEKGESTPEKSLYERLGGVNAISMVVDELIEALYVNEILNANPAIDKARLAVPRSAIKFKLTALICQVTGGPEVYTGRSMKDAHAHLNITEEHWTAMVADFKAVLDKFGVPEIEQNELFEIVGKTKGDIVMSSEGGDSK